MVIYEIIDKILASFIDNKITDKTFLKAVLMVHQIQIDDYDYSNLYDEIVKSGLFEWKDASSKDTRDMLFYSK